MNLAVDIAKLLLDIKAVTVSINPPYTWSSGIKAPIYCDNRLIISYPAERRRIIEGFKSIIKEKGLTFDVIGGTAMAGVPWAAFLAYELDKPLIYIRPEPKAHGKGKQVEGTMPRGARVLIVEDLISTGGSSLKSAVACVREYEAVVTDIIAIFTYEMQSARQAFSDAGISLATLSSFSTLIEVAQQEKYLTVAEKSAAFAWSTDPEHWFESLTT